MKRFSLYILSVIFHISLVHAQPSDASSLLKAACEKAAAENKQVLVMFTASWCGWCHKMDNSIQDPLCQPIFDRHYVICHMTVDETKDKQTLNNPGAKELRSKYFGDDQGIPYWLIFDKDGHFIADSKIRKQGEGPEKGANSGCPATSQEVAFFTALLAEKSGFTPEEVKIVGERFRRNEN